MLGSRLIVSTVRPRAGFSPSSSGTLLEFMWRKSYKFLYSVTGVYESFSPTTNEVVATEDSWKREYIGDAATSLWEHITKLPPSKKDVYAFYTAIVQSSGMGKSKMVDELAKTHFVIPIVLREASSTGMIFHMTSQLYESRSMSQDIPHRMAGSETSLLVELHEWTRMTGPALSSRPCLKQPKEG